MPADLDQNDPMMDPIASPEMGDTSQVGGEVPGLDSGETDREGAMAKADLFKLANYSHKLFGQIQDDQQLEAWVQAKITKAADYIASVYHYLEYEMKFSEYGHHLDNSDTLSEGQRMRLKEMLAEAKGKMKDLKKSQAEKMKEKKVDEGVLSGGERACTECNGTGMVYEEPKAIPDHVKSKVAKYNRQAKAFHAASKRLDRDGDGIPDNEETVDEETSSTGGTITREKGKVRHSHNPARFTDEPHAEPASKAKSKSSSEKAGDKAADKKTTKDSKDYEKRFPGSVTKVVAGKKVDPNAPKKKKEEDDEDLDETYGQGVYEAKKKGDGNLANNAKPYDKITRGDVIAGRIGKDEKGGKKVKEDTPTGAGAPAPMSAWEKTKALGSAMAPGLKNAAMTYGAMKAVGVKEAAKPSAGLSKAKKSAVVKDAKAGKDIGKPGKSFDKVAKSAGGGKKGEKIAAAAMWKNMKETVAYVAEKKAAMKKDQMADEGGNEFVGQLKKAREQGDTTMTVGGKSIPVKPGKPIPESTDFTRMQDQLARLNRNEKPALVENREVDQIRALTKKLLG